MPSAPADYHPPVTFRSLLFDDPDADLAVDRLAEPGCFGDIRLDQVVTAITAGREESKLAPFFRAPLRTRAAVTYRQDVFRDLGRPSILAALRAFAAGMRAMRADQHRARWAGHRLEEQRWMLAARLRYCAAVSGLSRDLATAQPAPASLALGRLAAYLDAEVTGGSFSALAADTARVAAGLATVTYRLEITGTRIRVGRWASPPPAGDGGAPEPDYGAEVRAAFERFRQGGAREFSFEIPTDDAMNPLEAELAERVARLYPDAFGALATYCAAHLDYLDETIVRLDRELAFCLAWLEHADRLAAAGLVMSLPEVTDSPTEASGRDLFDLALASARVREGATVVTNDLDVRPGERIVVISGPNQGGKTTFARTVGQVHYLASLGVPVPGRDVRVGLVDEIFTHFEREEDLRTLTSKLEDELLRIRMILETATPNSLVILNESFGSTSLEDALAIGRDVLGTVATHGPLCVFVTFLDELAAVGPGVVSMTSTVDPVDPAVRTFRVVRRPADGLAYADALARKHHLTEADIRARLGGRPA